MATDKHTAEPWHQNISSKYPIYAEWRLPDGRRDNRKIAVVLGGDAQAEADLRRIVACVNACAGIPTEALEAGALRAAREALDQYTTALHAFAIERPHATVRELSSYMVDKGIPAAAMAALAKLRGEG